MPRATEDNKSIAKQRKVNALNDNNNSRSIIELQLRYTIHMYDYGWQSDSYRYIAEAALVASRRGLFHCLL